MFRAIGPSLVPAAEPQNAVQTHPCTALSTPRMQSVRQGELQQMTHLHEALALDRFRLFAQPIVPLFSGAGGYQEVLVRLAKDNDELALPGAWLVTCGSWPAHKRTFCLGRDAEMFYCPPFERNAACDPENRHQTSSMVALALKSKRRKITQPAKSGRSQRN